MVLSVHYHKQSGLTMNNTIQNNGISLVDNSDGWSSDFNMSNISWSVVVSIDVDSGRSDKFILSVSTAFVLSGIRFLERVKVKKSGFVVAVNSFWKTSIDTSPFDLVNQRGTGCSTEDLSSLARRQELVGTSDDSNSGTSVGFNNFNVNVLGDCAESVASLASVSTSIAKTNVWMSDELFGDGNWNEVIREIATFWSGVAKI